MAVLVIGQLAGADAEADRQIMQTVGVSAENPPAGALLRMAGPVEGGYRVITVWETQEAWEAFRRDRLEPALRQMNRPMPSVEVAQLDSFMVPNV